MSDRPPDEMSKDRRCPDCHQWLERDWVWASEYEDTIVDDLDDYQAWFFVCENCAEHFQLNARVLEAIS